MEYAHRRHDKSDETWQLLEMHLPGRKGIWSGNARDNRQFTNAAFLILRSGTSWRYLPPDYGDWKNAHRRFCRCGNQAMAAQKGAQQLDASGRGCVWYAGPNAYYRRQHR